MKKGKYMLSTIRVNIIGFFLLLTLYCATGADKTRELDPLGTAQSGLKGVYLGPNKFGIYIDRPYIIGNMLIGGYRERDIRVIADEGCEIAAKFKSGVPDNPEQLYSIDHGLAFSCLGGNWSKDGKVWLYFPRIVRLYSLQGTLGKVGGVPYLLAREKYNLTENDLFLGRVDEDVFFWRPSSPARVHVKSLKTTHSDKTIDLPRAVIDVLGVTRGVHKEVCFVIFRLAAAGFIRPSPYEYAVWETNLPK